MRLSLCLCLLFLAGCGTPSFLITPVSGTFELHESVVQNGNGFGGGKIAIIPVEGSLIDVLSGGLLQVQENPLSLFVQELDKAAADDSVKAIVLRVNSPGGSVTTSDTMYDALLRFKAKTHKPVIASAQEVCASGAYYVTCGADKVLATPTSVVGSIGVIFESFEFVGTMEKLGVTSIVVKSAELKDMGSPFKHLTEHERDLMQQMVDEYYARFKSIVFTNRKITDPQQMNLVSDGQVFSGETAAKLGLVDQVGRLDDAIDLVRDGQCAGRVGGDVQPSVRLHRLDYASAATPSPQSKTSEMNLKLLPMSQDVLPNGFYYLWQP